MTVVQPGSSPDKIRAEIQSIEDALQRVQNIGLTGDEASRVSVLLNGQLVGLRQDLQKAENIPKALQELKTQGWTFEQEGKTGVYRGVKELDDIQAKPETGRLYEIDIPEDDQLLDYNEYLEDQPDAVRAALMKADPELVRSGIVIDGKEIRDVDKIEALNELKQWIDDGTSKSVDDHIKRLKENIEQYSKDPRMDVYVRVLEKNLSAVQQYGEKFLRGEYVGVGEQLSQITGKELQGRLFARFSDPQNITPEMRARAKDIGIEDIDQAEPDALASLYLSTLGIPGNVHNPLSGDSGYRNYVIWDTDKAKILTHAESLEALKKRKGQQ
jgi:hypothetical protein